MVGGTGFGAVTIDGPRAAWNIKGNLNVGGSSGGSGGIFITDGARLTVDGNLTLSANGSLHLVVGSGITPVAVGQTATLDGAVSVFVNGRIRPGARYTLLEADEVVGTFGEVELASLPMVRGALLYRGDSVEVEFIQNSFAGLSDAFRLTPNQRSVARALDKVAGSRRMERLFEVLNTLPLDQIPAALTLLSPEDLSVAYTAGFAANRVQVDTIERRLGEVRNGATGFSASGLSLRNAYGEVAVDGSGFTLAGFDGRSLAGKQVVPAPDSRWGFFVTGSGEFGDVETTAQALGSEFTTGGITVGVDYRVTSNLVMGITAGYAHADSDLNNGGLLKIDGGHLGLYGSLYGGGFYVNGFVSGGYNSYTAKRRTLGGTARGTSNGGTFNSLLGAGYDWQRGGLALVPWLHCSIPMSVFRPTTSAVRWLRSVSVRKGRIR